MARDGTNDELVQHYVRRAIDFFEAMDVLKEEDEYQNSSALLAIHSAIAFSDALRIGLGDEQLSASDHAEAASALERLLPADLIRQNGISHLRYLLRQKHAVAYGAQRLDVNAIGVMTLKAQRFALWANDTARKMNILGWRHAN